MGSTGLSSGHADHRATPVTDAGFDAQQIASAEVDANHQVSKEEQSRVESSSYTRERPVIRQATLICLAVTLLPLIIVAALLAKAQIDNSATFSQAQVNESEALKILNQARTVQLQDQAQVNIIQEKISAAEFGKAPGSGPVVEALQRELSNGENQLATAQGHFQAADNNYNSEQGSASRAENQLDSPLSRWIVYAGVAGAIIVGDTLFILYLNTDRQREIENKAIVRSIAESAAKLEAGVADVAELWLANERQLAGYHQLVLNYAATSRATTKFSLWFGFIFVAVLSACVIFTHSLAATVASSVIAAVGTVVTGFIARAILKNSETSSVEVMAFFSHPLETQRLLTARQIIDSMPEEAQAQAKLLLVRELLRANGSSRPPQKNPSGRDK